MSTAANGITDKELDIFIQMSSQLGSIESLLKNTNEKLLEHESRICQLEGKKSGSCFATATFKDSLIKWLTMALIGCISVLVTVTGASGIVSAFLGK